MKKQKIETKFIFPGEFSEEGYKILAQMVATYYDNPKNLEEYEQEHKAQAVSVT